LRITHEQALPCVIDAVCTVRTTIESQLSMGLPNSPMHGAQLNVVGGNFITAKPVGIKGGVDHCHTGHVRRIDTQAINRALEGDSLVLLSPLGYSPTGEVFNLSAEELATEIAVLLRADKLVFMCSQSGAQDASGELIASLDNAQAKDLLEQNTQTEEIQKYLHASVRASQGGVPRVHLVSHEIDGALLTELYTRDGNGTMITLTKHENLRNAGIKDVNGILELIRPLETQGFLVRRSRELLENEIDRFSVIELDGMIVACAALYPYDDLSGELTCFAVHPDYQFGGRGSQLLGHIVKRAQKHQLNYLAVLTTQAGHWFLEHSFKKSSVEELPAQKQLMYNWQRNSSIYFLNVDEFASGEE